MKGSCYAANCSGFCQGFYIHGLVPKSQGPKGAKDITDECKGSSKPLLWPRASDTICLLTPKTNK